VQFSLAQLYSLKGQCHEFEKDNTGFQVIGLKSLWLLEHILNSFWCYFYAFIQKNYVSAVSHLAVTVRMTSDSRITAP
jgi:hypothetical protein